MTADSELKYKNSGNFKLLGLISASPGRVLDCGCGAGDNARILRQRGWCVTGVTIDPQEQAAAQQFCEEVYIADLENGLPSEIAGPFDAVIASHVLEHLARPERLLRELHSILSPHGVLAVALPNIAHYRQRFLRLRGQFNYTETGQLDRTHLRFYTYRTARQLLEENQYELISVEATGSLPLWKARMISPDIASRVDKWAVSQHPNLLGYECHILARPRAHGKD
jgi:2-polyprenyl-3-methyl-5-hydroxy-6-metoxy-1,4-benzoquinol methylase